MTFSRILTISLPRTEPGDAKMNYKLIANYIGNILRIEGLFMIPALLVSLYHNEFKCVLAFGISIAALLVIGQLMHMIKPKKRNIFVREGFAIVSLSWLAISLFGALPRSEKKTKRVYDYREK